MCASQELGQAVGAMNKAQQAHLREQCLKLQGKPVLLVAAASQDGSRKRGPTAMLAALRGGSDLSLISELSDPYQAPASRQMLLHQVQSDTYLQIPPESWFANVLWKLIVYGAQCAVQALLTDPCTPDALTTRL